MTQPDHNKKGKWYATVTMEFTLPNTNMAQAVQYVRANVGRPIIITNITVARHPLEESGGYGAA